MKRQLLILSISSLLLIGCANEAPISSSNTSSSDAITISSTNQETICSSSTSKDDETSSSHQTESISSGSSSSKSDSYYIEILPSSIDETKSQTYLVDYLFSVFDALNKEYEFVATGIQRGGGDHENTIQCNGKDNGKNPIGAISSLESLHGTARIIQLDKGEYTGTPIFKVDEETIGTEPKVEDGKRTYEFPIDGVFSFSVTPGLAIYLYSIAFFN